MSILCSGSFVADILVPDLPQIGSPGSLTYAPNGIHLYPGGHSSNLAINLTQLGITNIHAVGCIGNDEIGQFLVKQLKNRGINVKTEINHHYSTAKNIALLVKGDDKRYISELTSNSKLTAEHLIKTINEIKPSLLYQGTLGGLPYIEKKLKVILEKSKEYDTINFLDVIMPTHGWQYLENSAAQIDILHINKLEAYHFTRKNKIDEALTYITELGVKLGIISDGKNGLTAGTINMQISMPSFKVNQRDPTGAGDALSAGAIKHIIENKIKLEQFSNPNILKSLLLESQAAGAACVTELGATTSVTRENVDNLLQEQGKQILKKTRLKKQ